MSRLVIEEYPLLILPSLASIIGLNEAIILQQIHYWLDPRVNKNIFENKYWVFNSYEQWKKQFPFFSQITIKRTIISLEKKGLVISSVLNKDRFNKTKWYSINYKNLKLIEPISNSSDKVNTVDLSIKSNPNIKLIKPSKDIDTQRECSKNTLSSFSDLKVKNISKEYEREKEMINIWDKEIREGEKPSLQSKLRLINLRKVVEEYFEGNLDNWKSYCLEIKKCNFLMGEGVNHWKADLSWATKQDNLIRVLEGFYYQKKEKTVENNIIKETLINEEGASHDPTWNKVLEKLKINKGEATYKSWFKKLDFEGYDNNRLLLIAPSRFIKDWILEKFSNDIIRLFKELEINIKDIEIFVRN